MEALLIFYPMYTHYRNNAGPIPYGSFDKGYMDIRAEENSNGILFHHPPTPEQIASSGSEGNLHLAFVCITGACFGQV